MRKFSDEDIQEFKNIVRTGIVSSVNSGNMTARVHIQQQGITSDDLKIIQNAPEGCEPWKPKVGQWVACIFEPDGGGDGFILGGI